jgi:hypothetical protein
MAETQFAVRGRAMRLHCLNAEIENAAILLLPWPSAISCTTVRSRGLSNDSETVPVKNDL